MNTILGANWRTTLTGWIAVLASAIAINPSLVAFLPESLRNYVTGIAGLLSELPCQICGSSMPCRIRFASAIG